ncbi:MAG: cell division protein SepF [Gomphosphaeria aponina SAG 52.96 = DSM 107014]|uniref:Cell division protein SepF n=1 Tax=Gomphosphaeria aponina SAG 52.96 = DSM 107014 TaxID=1521640 RepID=A0A941GY02_9CHRO|nr:cell division protein SepF [Gomphosphaeria aponina SAG 52.96 = DSM 107014]
MNTFLTKLKDFVGLNEEADEEDEEFEEEIEGEISRNSPEKKPQVMSNEQPRAQRLTREQPTKTTEIGMVSNTRSNVIGMPGVATGMSEVVVIEPHSFKEMPQVIQTLRERRSVILNLNVMEPAEAQRAVDFVAGGTYAIDGHQERIGESIFLFTPNCVKVSTLTGAVHEAMEATQVPASVPLDATPPWATESNRIAQ